MMLQKSAEVSWEVFLEEVTLDVSYKIQTISEGQAPLQMKCILFFRILTLTFVIHTSHG